MKKSTGWVVFGVAAATVAAGAYYVYKHQDRFFKSEEVLTPDGPIQKRNYLALDMEGAKSQINESFTKTKEAAQETIKKVGNSFKGKGNKEEDAAEEDIFVMEETFETEEEMMAEMEADEAKEEKAEAEVAQTEEPAEETPAEEIAEDKAEEKKEKAESSKGKKKKA